MKPEEFRKKTGMLMQKAGDSKQKNGDMDKKSMNWFRSHKIETGVAAALIILLGASALYRGEADKMGQEPGISVETQVETVVPLLETDLVPELDEDQISILEDLTKELRDRNYEGGGALLLDNEQKLQYLFYQTLQGEPYIYKSGKLSRDLEGEGLVLKKPMSVFYGSLKDGVPEGEGAALQGIVLDGQRYDYSDGYWKGGKLNGPCTVGYHYYEGAQGGESQAVERKGMFVEDLMSGSFVYQTISADGEVTVWDMEAEDGRTKLDERWIYDEEKEYYYLPSKEISSHTYVLPDNAVGEQRWRNMLPWVE